MKLNFMVYDLLNEEQCDSKCVVGDLLWAKIGKHPFWPCMVSYDPFEGCYFKKKRAQATETIIYHVQYFGKQSQHGWTSPGLILPFEGEDAYHATRKQLRLKGETVNARKKILAKYSIPPGVLEDWVNAVREAEGAMQYEVHERYESYVFKYDFDFKKSESKKGASKEVRNKGESNKPVKAKEVYGTDEKVCKICDKGKVDLFCTGICAQYFHKECLGLISVPENFMCFYCEQGLSTCFICKKAATSGFKCRKCKYHYHEECLQKYTCANVQKKICSYHACLSCYNENSLQISEGSFINCILCPTASHATLHCMPVGSMKLSSSTMVWPEHFLEKNKVSPQVTSNVSYCSVCAKGLEEPSEAYDQYVFKRQRHSLDWQRFAYKHIKVNRAIPPAKINHGSGKSVLPCSCNPHKAYPCGPASGCLNRSMLIECHPDVCPAAERCGNQRFQRRTYAEVEVFRTLNRGWGLLSMQFIPKGSFVIECVGEVITHEEYKRRVVLMKEKNEQNYYFLYLDAHRMIDAGSQGNYSRFINHSCNANCEMSKWSVKGDCRIGVFAIQDINPAEELTLNYQSDSHQFKQKCYCGSAHCQGFI